MAECAYCKAETQLYDRTVPICTKCSAARDGNPRKPSTSEQNVPARLLQELLEATAQSNQAAREFKFTLSNFPSGLPHPDGSQRVQNASQNLTLARKALTKAHRRLTDYHQSGLIPKDLKQAG